MNCNLVNEKLVEYLKQELAGPDRKQVEDHLRECATCARELGSLERLWQDLERGTELIPSVRLRDRFYSMLRDEIVRHESKDTVPQVQPGIPALFQSLWPSRPQWALAYSFLVVLGGFTLGRLLAGDAVTDGQSGQQEEIARIREDMSDLKDLMALTLLSQGSVQARLQGIDYARQSGAGDTRVLSLLLNTLERDDTRNVRLAALDALAPHLDIPMVRERLYNSLLQETSPIVQLKVVELLVKTAGDDGPGLVNELVRAGILDADVERYLEDAGKGMI